MAMLDYQRVTEGLGLALFFNRMRTIVYQSPAQTHFYQARTPCWNLPILRIRKSQKVARFVFMTHSSLCEAMAHRLAS